MPRRMTSRGLGTDLGRDHTACSGGTPLSPRCSQEHRKLKKNIYIYIYIIIKKKLFVYPLKKKIRNTLNQN